MVLILFGFSCVMKNKPKCGPLLAFDVSSLLSCCDVVRAVIFDAAYTVELFTCHVGYRCSARYLWVQSYSVKVTVSCLLHTNLICSNQLFYTIFPLLLW